MTTATFPVDGLDPLLAATVATLAGAAFTGRRAGTPGGVAACDWLTRTPGRSPPTTAATPP